MTDAIVQNAAALKGIAAGIAIGFGVIGPGIGLGLIGKSALDAIGRNPEAQQRIITVMMIMVAFTEALAIYALVISLLILFT